MKATPVLKPYLLAVYESVLGARVCRQLRATPPTERGSPPHPDRDLLNEGALAYWVLFHCDIVLGLDDDTEAVETDPDAEWVRVEDQVFALPDWCYLSTGVVPGDPRPRVERNLDAADLPRLQREALLAAGQREFPLTGCEPPGRPLTWGSRRPGEWGQ